MAKTSVGAIYATNSKLLQRVYIPDSDDSEIDRQHVLPGESVLRVPIETYRTGGYKAVQAIIGEPAHDGRCALVHKDTGEVIDVIVADPAIFQHPDGHLTIQHSHVLHGDVWDGDKFMRRYVDVHPETGIVAAVHMQPINDPKPRTAGHLLMVAHDKDIGHQASAKLGKK